jgi:hypothetical protein
MQGIAVCVMDAHPGWVSVEGGRWDLVTVKGNSVAILSHKILLKVLKPTFKLTILPREGGGRDDCPRYRELSDLRPLRSSRGP